MSMQINHMRSVLQLALPLLLLIGSAGLAVWQGCRVAPLPIDNQLVLHQSLTNIPPAMAAESRPLVKDVGKDPFFRTAQGPDAEGTPIVDMANLEEIHLTTIAQGKQGRYCIVNGEIFHEKQQGKSFTVTQIAQEQVDFQTSRQSFFLLPGQRAAIQAGKLVPLEKVAVNAADPLMDQTSLYE